MTQDTAPRIVWRNWGAAALQEAETLDRPILLTLTARWCIWSRRMDETTWADPAVRELVATGFVPVRSDTDREPDVQVRYMTEGWPTTAFLTPGGEVLWSGTFVEPEELPGLAQSVLAAWGSRREELLGEIERRRRALQAARGRTSSGGFVRREAADDVATVLRDAFDPRNGGFGTAPKFPPPDALELLYALAPTDDEWRRMADQTLDGMLAGELYDPDGGFRRYALQADWTEPRPEKLLDLNAALVEAYSLGARLRDRLDWTEIVERTIAWADGTLRRPDGLWGASQCDDAVDDTVITAANARWIGALALAGGRLERSDWIDGAATALDTLVERMGTDGGGFHHYLTDDGDPRGDHLFEDALEVLAAALRVAQASGRRQPLQLAERTARHVEQRFWADHGFRDTATDATGVGAVRFSEQPFEANARAARLLLDLAHVTGQRTWRALAERVLARLAPVAGRYGPAAAVFALATTEYFDPPVAVFIAAADPADDEAARLRTAALALPVAPLRVWTVEPGHATGAHVFEAKDGPTAWVVTDGRRSGAKRSPGQLTEAAAAIDA